MNKDREIWPRVLSAFIDSEPIVMLYGYTGKIRSK